MHDSGIASQSLALLLGGVAGGLVSGAIVGVTWFLDRRSGLLREFLREGQKIHALREAWIYNGPSSHFTKVMEDGQWLHEVEVRSVLDQAVWNAPKAQDEPDEPDAPAAYYDFLKGRRTWIVRYEVLPQRSYGGPDIDPKQSTHPALLSSQAIHELCGWIERVASVNRRLFLDARACRALWHLLACVAGEDRITIFGHRLTKEAADFLRWYRKEYPLPR